MNIICFRLRFMTLKRYKKVYRKLYIIIFFIDKEECINNIVIVYIFCTIDINIGNY